MKYKRKKLLPILLCNSNPNVIDQTAVKNLITFSYFPSIILSVNKSENAANLFLF